MIEIRFASDHNTIAKVATYLRTWRITVFYNQEQKIYFVNVTSVREMYKVASALALYSLIEADDK